MEFLITKSFKTMKKKSVIRGAIPLMWNKKCLRIMRLTFLFLFVGLMQVSASLYSQSTKLSLDLRNTRVSDVLEAIERQSEFRFAYSAEFIDMNRKVNVDIKGKSIEQTLSVIFEGTDVKYSINNRHILLFNDEMPPSETMQQKGISGKVTDSFGSPLPGVSVVVKGTTNGTITDADGNYSISNAPENATLQFSFVGMKGQEVVVAGKTSINVKMEEETVGIEEVVAVGYGVQKKVNVIGSISQITSDKLTGRSVPLLSSALTGQMTGVSVITRSGAPGASSTIRVRGVGSFGASPEALVLVDGIPGNINDVRPEEVESISVLKDASSAAIYGARAANGVILITTKAGKSTKVKVNYNAYGGFVAPTALPEMLNSWDYALAYNEASGTQRYSADDIAKFKDGNDPVNFPNSNILKEVLDHKGFQTGHDLTLSGGNEINQYYFAVGYLSQDGIVEKNNYSRYNARLNMISALTPKLKVTTRLSGVTSQINEPASPGSGDVFRVTDGIIRESSRVPSVYASILPDGSFGLGPASVGTPVSRLKSASFYENPRWKFAGNVDVTYKPIDDLIITAIGGYNFIFDETRTFRSTQQLSDLITVGPSNLVQTGERTQYKTLQTTVDYNKDVENHHFSVLLGYSFEQQEFRDMVGYRDKFPSNELPYIDAGAPDNQQVSGGGYDWAIQSVFGRIKYNYNEKYLFEATVRNDGSSRFPETRKYGLFPSLAVGWRISEEPFVKNKLAWLTNLKIKASWGKLGNQNIGNYSWQSTYELGRDYVFGGSIRQGAAMLKLTDPNLHWENTQTADIGFESSVFDGKLNFNISYFHRKTSDILYKPTSSVSKILGMNLSEMNTGSLQNNGLELELGHENKIGEFKYHVNANFTLVNNKVLDLGVGNVTQPNGLVGNGSNLFIGYPMQLYYGLTTDGVFIDQTDIDEWYLKNDQSSINPKASAKPGDFRYVDISGDGMVDLANDRKVLGSQIPKYNYSLNLGFEYKGFDFSAILQGVAGVKGLLDGFSGFAFYNLGNVQEWMWNGRFDPANPTRYPEYPRLQILGNSIGVNGQLSDFWTLNASYIRLKNIQLGYSMSPGLLKMMRVDGLRVYVSSENPLTFHNYRKGWDPEINSNGAFYPILATYTFGINIKF
jgi:TonB-linked SusC/RagA family outer membrane protein